jgi:hypothetical protein
MAARTGKVRPARAAVASGSGRWFAPKLPSGPEIHLNDFLRVREIVFHVGVRTGVGEQSRAREVLFWFRKMRC